MRRPRLLIPLCCLGALLLCIFFFVTADIGRQREKEDVAAIREIFREREAVIRGSLAKVGDGIPLEDFRRLFPEARFSDLEEEWIVRIPLHYDENPESSGTDEETRHFKLEGAVLQPSGRGSGGVIACSFGERGSWYYFWRAWYSTAEGYRRRWASTKS